MRRRTGFTITELLVAMALIIFIMYILAEAFGAGAGAFRRLKAIGDMNEKLRTAGGLMRRYLQADHFEGKKRLSDPNFWIDGPPREGFLRIYQASDGIYEGSDLETNASYNSVDHGLHFAVKLRGNNRGDFFRASITDTSTAGGSPLLRLPYLDTRFQEPPQAPPLPSTLCSPWAEVAFFLRPLVGEVAEDPERPTLAPQQLYALYMRQKLCIPDNEQVTPLGQVSPSAYPGYTEVSCYEDPRNANALYFNSPFDVTMPRRRMNPALNTSNNAAFVAADLASSQPVYAYRTQEEDPTPALALLPGNDILLNNVLSFDVRILIPRDHFNRMIQAFNATNPNPPLQQYELNYDFISLHHRAFKYWMPNLNKSFNTNYPAYRMFDTWSGAKDDSFDYSLWRPNPAANPFFDPTQQRDETIPLWISRTGDLIRIQAIQITLRIWDTNTKQTRQTSIVVDL